MIGKTIILQDSFPTLSSLSSPTELIPYCREPLRHLKPRRFPALIVCPGGGYGGLADREGEPIALAMLAQGIQCFVLRYHTAPTRYPTQLTEVAAAVCYIREHAEEYSVDPDRIFVIGFSAGGHLAGSYATHWHDIRLDQTLACNKEMLRPNGAVLCYGVLSGMDYTHDGSMQNLLGDQDSPEMRKFLSFEHNVTAETPPIFLFHTVSDQAAPVENSLLAAQALAAQKIPFEMHIYPEGLHGLALANKITDFDDWHPAAKAAARWIEDCADWMLRPKEIC